MQKMRIKPSSISGRVWAPPSKSHSLRALLFASLARGTSHLRNVLDSPDIESMIAACRQLGAHINQHSASEYHVTGVAGQLHVESGTQIDAGNSGQVLRYLTAVMATQSEKVVVTGDDSICSNRTVSPYLESFPQLGVSCNSLNSNDHAPLDVRGPFSGNVITLDGEDSQIITGLCIAATLVDGATIIHVKHPGEIPWIQLTLDWLSRLHVPFLNDNFTKITVQKKIIDAFNYTVPGDFSSIAFPVAAALVTHSPLEVCGIDWNDTQGDKALFFALNTLGANLEIDASKGLIRVRSASRLGAGKVDINNFIDAITILAVLATQASGPVRIVNAAVARKKECNRITAIAQELSKMGAKIETQHDGLVIYPGSLHGAIVESHGDHRMAMSLAVAGLIAKDETLIYNTACVDKSYKDFVMTLQQLGASIEVL